MWTGKITDLLGPAEDPEGNQFGEGSRPRIKGVMTRFRVARVHGDFADPVVCASYARQFQRTKSSVISFRRALCLSALEAFHSPPKL